MIEKIKAEIERRIKERVQMIKDGDKQTRPNDGSVSVELMSLLSFIESLEKEQDVDLKKEIVEMMAKQPFFIKAKDQIAFARHFYELGCRHAAVLYDDIEFERQRRCEEEKSEIPTIKGWVER